VELLSREVRGVQGWHEAVESRHGVDDRHVAAPERADSQIFLKSNRAAPTVRDDYGNKESNYQQEQEEARVRAPLNCQEGSGAVSTYPSTQTTAGRKERPAAIFISHV
jgi:hypothetical protein